MDKPHQTSGGQGHLGNGHPVTRHTLDELGAARERLQEVGKAVVSFIRAQPAAALVIALSAGFLCGRLVRR
jgi:hypothetical protein